MNFFAVAPGASNATIVSDVSIEITGTCQLSIEITNATIISIEITATCQQSTHSLFKYQQNVFDVYISNIYADAWLSSEVIFIL